MTSSLAACRRAPPGDTGAARSSCRRSPPSSGSLSGRPPRRRPRYARFRRRRPRRPRSTARRRSSRPGGAAGVENSATVVTANADRRLGCGHLVAGDEDGRARLDSASPPAVPVGRRAESRSSRRGGAPRPRGGRRRRLVCVVTLLVREGGRGSASDGGDPRKRRTTAVSSETPMPEAGPVTGTASAPEPERGRDGILRLCRSHPGTEDVAGTPTGVGRDGARGRRPETTERPHPRAGGRRRETPRSLVRTGPGRTWRMVDRAARPGRRCSRPSAA